MKKKKASGSVYDLPLFQPLKGGNGDDSDELVRKALANHPVFKTLTDLDINTLTPLEALTALSDLKKQLDEEDPPFISDQP